MGKVIVTRRYSGRAVEPVSWEALVRIFDGLWGKEYRSLPTFPKVFGGVLAWWDDAEGVRHEVASLNEVGDAYQQEKTGYIFFGGSINNGPKCIFEYRPAKALASIEVQAGDQATAEQLAEIVRKEFPLVAKYIFISYDTSEYEIATFIAKVLEKRLLPGISVFVAIRDISPGSNPLKVMLEDQLLRAEALLALCSQQSKTSPWLWWESSAVWAKGGLVIPIYINISPKDFNGPISWVCQGRSLFDVTDINSALSSLVDKVCPGHKYEELTSQEIEELKRFRSRFHLS